jgi:hypothetical protein
MKGAKAETDTDTGAKMYEIQSRRFGDSIETMRKFDRNGSEIPARRFDDRSKFGGKRQRFEK